MKDLTVGQVIKYFQNVENRLGEETPVRLSCGNGYDRPELDTQKDEYGVKFVLIS